MIPNGINKSHRNGKNRIPTPTVENLLTYKQAAQILGVSDRTVWTLVDTGKLPNVRFGNSVRIDPADLRAFIDNGKTRETEVAHESR